MLKHEEKQTCQKMEQVVVESFDVVKKWLKKSLLSKIPCYTIPDTEKELEVCTLLLILSFMVCFEQQHCWPTVASNILHTIRRPFAPDEIQRPIVIIDHMYTGQ